MSNKRNIRFRDFIGLSLIAMTVLYSCKGDDIIVNDPDDDMRSISITGPFISASYTLQDFLEDLEGDGIFSDEDGLLYYQTRQDVEIEWDDLVTLNDVNSTWNHYIPPFNTGSGDDGSFEFSDRAILSHRNDVRYDSLDLTAGVLRIAIASPYGLSGTVTVDCPGMTSGGEPVSITFTVYGNGMVSPEEFSLPLEGMHLNLESNDEAPYQSSLWVNTRVALEGLSYGGDLTVYFSLSDMEAEAAYGYFGTQETTKTDVELDFELFDEIDDLKDRVRVDRISISIQLHNSIGTPFYVETRNMRFYKDDDEDPYEYLTVDGSSTLVIDNVPASVGGEPGFAEVVIDDKSDSNVLDIANGFPRSMKLDIFSRSNPDAGSDPESEPLNYKLAGQDLVAALVAKIPFTLSAAGYERRDTIEFDFNDMIEGSENEVESIELASVYFDFENGLPLSISASAYVIDGNGDLIDYVLDEGTSIIIAGTAARPEASSFKVDLTEDQIEAFRQREAKQLILHYEVMTGKNGESVEITTKSSLKAKISLNAKGTIPN